MFPVGVKIRLQAIEDGGNLRLVNLERCDNGLDIPNEDVLIRCAEIAALHSKAKNSSNVPVDYCKVKYVKKPNGAKPGMVIYAHNHTLYVNPKNM